MRFYTADAHFGHFNVLKYCDRPFPTLHEMHKALTTRWNALVRPEDTVIYLGDFCFHVKKHEVLAYLEKLNGKKILIRGNHDHKATRKAFRPECYDEMEVQIGPYNCMCAHVPLYPPGGNVPERDQKINASRMEKYAKYDFIISGHRHEKALWTGNSINVGVDQHDFYPLSEDRLLDFLDHKHNETKRRKLCRADS
jgi:calcineurin-like phosphoesterase family protein